MLIKWLNIKRITGAGWLKSYYDAGHYTYYIAPVRVIHGLFAFLPLADGAPDLKKSAPFLIHINSVSIIMSAF